MAILKHIEKIQTIHMESLKKAIDLYAVDKISKHSRAIEEAESLSVKIGRLEKSLRSLEKGVESSAVIKDRSHRESQNINSEFLIQPRLSNKEKGNRKRKKFLKRILSKNIVLDLDKGIIYKTLTGEKVGIAYASERQRNRWFLGLPSIDYYTFVLLCELKSSQMLSFIFPKFFFEKIKNLLSSKNGQLKLNVSYKKEHYYLSIPQSGAVEITKYLDNFEAFE